MITRKTDVLWTYFAKFFNLSVNIILLPLILAYLTDMDLALWYVFASISQIVNLFDFGFNATIARHVTYAWSGAKSLSKDRIAEYSGEESANVVLLSQVKSTCKIVYLVISIFSLVIMLTGGSIYIYHIVDGRLTRSIIFSWIIYSIAVFLNLLYGYWSSLLLGIGAVAERNRMAIYSKIIQIVLAYILLFAGYGLLGFVTAYAVSGVTLRLLGRYYFEQKTRGLNISDHVKMSDIKECFEKIWSTAWRDGIVMVSQYLCTQANTLLCAYFVDLSSTSSYGVITQITSMIGSLAASYYSAYQPQYSSLSLKHDRDALKKLTCRCGVIYKFFYILIFGLFITIGIPLLHLLRPSMIIEWKMVFILAAFYYLYNQHSMYCSMIAASNRIPYYKSFLLTAIVSISLSVALSGTFKMGIYGLILAQLLANLIYNNWFWPKFLLKEQNISYVDLYKIGLQQFHWLLHRKRIM